MTIAAQDLLQKSKKSMEKSIEHLKYELSKLRVGRASIAMVDGVKVSVYGAEMTLKEVATLTLPDTRTISIEPWDKTLLSEIEKGILVANIGLTPNNDGKVVRLILPPVTEDRRKEIVKQVKKMGEDAKVGIRSVRRDLMADLKKAKDETDLSEDTLKKAQDDAQKLTDHAISDVDKIIEAKSKEVMTI